MNIIELIFRSFWTFLGTTMLAGMALHYLFLFWNRFLRSFTLRKHGYPPPHCDADGDFKPDEKEEDNSNG